jgi:hypothetical protein
MFYWYEATIDNAMTGNVRWSKEKQEREKEKERVCQFVKKVILYKIN